jgi:peptidyl-prolyl cis-trans isomerase B (cyclophilin B)
MKKWMSICAAAVLAVSALAGCSTSAGTATTAAQTEAAKAETAEKETIKTAEASEGARDTASEEIKTAAGKHHVKINVKDYGTISVELYGDEAPITVANFLELAKDGFYDGLTFHRIISGFMIQGGDPLGTGMGGSDQEIKGEFSSNGVENPLSHTRGAISMARSQIKDSASSQFFIVHEDSTFLDGDYACFGYVTEGMEVVDAICEDTKVEDNNGSVAKANQPVIESIEVVD